jgi:hypothetical protein
VQYTRNPDGIAGALAKIRDHYSARIESPAASELNHFLFATSLNTLFATHPPLDERIKRLAAMGAVRTTVASASPELRTAARGSAAAGTAAFAGGPPPLPRRPAVNAIGLAGTLEPEMVARSRAWLEGVPSELADAVHRSSGARALCYLIARRTEGAADAARLVERDDPEAARTLFVATDEKIASEAEDEAQEGIGEGVKADVEPELLYNEGPMSHEFPRTASRLREMQSGAFLALGLIAAVVSTLMGWSWHLSRKRLPDGRSIPMHSGQDRSISSKHSGARKATMPTMSMMLRARGVSLPEMKSMRTWALCRKA